MLARLDQDRVGAHRYGAAAVGAARRAGLVLDQGDAFTVNRDIDVLVARVRSGHQIHFEHIFRVRRKDVLDDRAAARAVRRALDVIPRMLRHISGAAVSGVHRRRVAIADRHAADRARCVQIRLEQSRRQRLRVGDVVEVGALGVQRQPVAGVHVEREQIVHGARVFRPVQTLEGADAGIGLRGSRRVDLRLERRDQRRVRRGVWPRRQRGRHEAGLQFPDDLFRDLGVLRCLRDVERGE